VNDRLVAGLVIGLLVALLLVILCRSGALS